MSVNRENRFPRVDFHVHTCASDGTDSPADVVRLAAESGVGVIAITDHDTVAGLDEAVTEAAHTDIRVIRGVELSAEYGSHSVHILGLGLGCIGKDFMDVLQQISDGRKLRNPRIVHKLNLLGFELTMDDVASFADGDIVGRIHIAQALLHRGYVQNIEEAFNRFIGKGKAAYVDRFRLSIREAVDMIHGIGGIAIAAHPGLLPGADDPETVRRQFSDFKDIGMDGVETHYPMHSAKYFREVANLAREMNLLESGGSDYHGTVKTNRMGYGCGDQPIPASYLKPLLDRLESQYPSANGIGRVL